MKDKRISKTASIVAAVRAKHRLYDSPIIFNDPWAIKLTSGFWRFVCGNRFLAACVFDTLLADLRPAQASVLCRARFAEDALERSLEKNIQDYIILGAGLDSFALRRVGSMEALRVWELDAPTTQQYKKKLVMKLLSDMPANLHYVPVDFERQDFQASLVSSGFSKDVPAFFSILGLSYYIQERVFLEMMATIANDFCSGTELVVDIRVPKECGDSCDFSRFEKIEKFTARRGEQLVTQLNPEYFSNVAKGLGFELCEHLSPKMQRERYCQGRDDGLSPTSEIHLFHFRVP
ncbi:transferase [Pseudomonas agarici]|uniref:S-adenosyl-L-methionine-dependent methyltransferase n=1 Tax=Pseudomonas agarici TaxID=46677 RepID=A0A0X1SYV6_PSEAA|nr:SAM-dependent methyltransferase [Pseudomonas agarici]AMB84729.1 transferase [Pseudomonas agarici]